MNTLLKSKARYSLNSTNTRVLHYPLNRLSTATTVMDSSSGLLPGTVTAAVSKHPGFYFNGATHKIDPVATFQTIFRASYSISLWCKPSDGQPAAQDVLIGVENALDEDDMEISIETTGKVRFQMQSNDNETYAEGADATFADGAGAWTHIVCTAEADTALLIYINGAALTLGAGAAAGDGDASGLTFADWTIGGATDYVYIGGANTIGTGLEQPFVGLIGDVMIFSELLTAQKARDIYEMQKQKYGR